MPQKQHNVCPEIPHGPQCRGNTAEVQNHAPCCPQHHEGPQLSVTPAQQKRKGSCADRETVAAVQRRRKPRKPQAKGPQHIVNQGKSQPQQDRLQEGRQLL